MELVLVDFNKIIGKVKEENAFKLENGQSLRSLSELVLSLKNMDETSFTNHVNNEKNDFANWIRFSFDDELLSTRLKTQLNKNDTIQEIIMRLQQANESLEVNNNPNNKEVSEQINQQPIKQEEQPQIKEEVIIEKIDGCLKSKNLMLAEYGLMENPETGRNVQAIRWIPKKS